MVRWGDTFWGEGNRGFEVLSTNVKNGGIAIEEFQRFLNESLQCETTYWTKLTRLQSQCLKIQHVGTFTPIWHSIRDLLEKIAQAHATTVSFYQDLLRDIHLYQEAYQKKVKTAIHKDPDIARTADLISQLNTTLNNVNKAKEQYHSIGLDYERAKRAGSNLSNGSSTPVPIDNPPSSSLAQSALNSLTSSSRQLERLEKKYRQSHDDYRASIEKYNAIRSEFEKRFYDACNKFQDFEVDYVEKMLAFAVNYSEILQRGNEQTRQAQNEFHEKLKLFTGAELIEGFVEQKRTGSERPAPVQFEELDHLKTSLHLTNSSTTSDATPPISDELIIFDTAESTALPSFQAHFPVASPVTSSAWPSNSSMKKSESNRGLASSTSLGYTQNNNRSMSPSFNPTGMSLNNPNNPLARLQETSNDQTSNPFDLIIKRPVLKGFWPSNRKEKKEKKNDKKTSKNPKGTKAVANPQQPLSSILDDQNLPTNPSDETNEFHRMMGSIDGLNQISNITKSKCPTPEPYTQSSPSLPPAVAYRAACQSTIPFSSSSMRKSTSSSDSSDDDEDDLPISKINFKINPTAAQKPAITEENDEAKISNAMRLVDKNIGHFATYSRAARGKLPDMSKSVSSGQILGRIPPPLPSRPTSTLATSITADQFPPSTSLTNTNDAFDPRPKSISISSPQQENFPPVPSRSMTMTSNEGETASGRKPIAMSAIDDDQEVTKISSTATAGRTSRPRQTMIRWSLIERIRSIWKLSSKRSPIVFRKLSRPASFRLLRKSSEGFPTDLIDDQSSLQSFYTARETFSISDDDQPPTPSSTAPSIANGRMTPFIASTSQSFANGLSNSIDQRASPLTIGPNDQIPIAVAFQETIHVMMSGDDQSKWKIRILGDMLVSFPAAILNVLLDPSPHLNALEFRLQNLHKVENIIPNPQLVTQNPSPNESEGPTYSFNMTALSNTLRTLQEKNRSLPFFNFGILKYEVKHLGVANIPIQVSSHWSRTFETISVQINYRFKSSTFPETIRIVNDIVTFSTNIIDGQEILHSSPQADWSPTEHKLSWRVPYIFDGTGTLSATIKVVPPSTEESHPTPTARPLTTSSIVHVQFLGENALFSSIDFEFACRGYRISLLKKKICSGKYQSEADQNEPIQLFRRPSVDQHRLSLSSPLVA